MHTLTIRTKFTFGDRVCWEGDLPELPHALAPVLVRDALGHARLITPADITVTRGIRRYLAALVRDRRDLELGGAVVGRLHPRPEDPLTPMAFQRGSW